MRSLTCVNTLCFDTPIWSLSKSTQSLSKFWVGCRDGSVLKIARGKSRLQYDDAISLTFNTQDDYKKDSESLNSVYKDDSMDVILLVKELFGITDICGVDGEYIWVSTTSCNLNKYSDLNIEKSQILYSNNPIFDINEYPSLVPKESLIQTLEITDSIPIPLYMSPISCLKGGACLLKQFLLNDKRRIVVLDSFGLVSIYDIIHGTKLMDIPQQEGLSSIELFDKAILDNNTNTWVANWCTIDLTCGVLLVNQVVDCSFR